MSSPTSPFLERIARGPILADGGMGTMLYNRGISFERCFDSLNLTDRDVVLGVHQDYIRAGAQFIETNTFGGNSVRLSSHGLEGKVRDVNYHGARIAREAREIMGADVLIAGSMGPLGKNLSPIGAITIDQAQSHFSEQVQALLEGGVDLFVVETISDPAEMSAAVAAIRSLTGLPIVAQMTFTEEGMTLTGRSPEEIGAFLNELPVEVIGANCSVGPQGMLEVISRLTKVAKKPLSAMPNAGMPRLVDGRFVYPSHPSYFAGLVGPFLAQGVRLLGGCCGTTPEHIAAMREVLDVWRPADAVGPKSVTFVSTPPPERLAGGERSIERSRFASNLGRKFQVSVELDPPKGSNPAKVIDGARLCKAAGCDAVNIGDSPMARVRMSAVATAALIEREVGIDTVLHFTCRDRNLMGIQSDLIGAHALGIRNVLAITGDPPSVGDYPHVTGVFDVESIGLVKVLAGLNEGKDFAGASIGHPTNLAIGVALNPVADDWDRELERFRAKVDAGAQFAFTQPLYRIEPLLKTLEAIQGFRIPVFLGLLPLMSFRHAWFLHNEVPGVVIPDRDLEHMKQAGERGADVGIAICRELLENSRSLVDGVYLMPSFGRYETCLRVVEGFIERSASPYLDDVIPNHMSV
jgi:homocysteine S-methyltransferase